ncbi:Paraquat-inducible protein B, partial [Haemophilus influenzae]
IRFSRVR